jgi:hypothetical protein
MALFQLSLCFSQSCCMLNPSIPSGFDNHNSNMWRVRFVKLGIGPCVMFSKSVFFFYFIPTFITIFLSSTRPLLSFKFYMNSLCVFARYMSCPRFMIMLGEEYNAKSSRHTVAGWAAKESNDGSFTSLGELGTMLTHSSKIIRKLEIDWNLLHGRTPPQLMYLVV